MVPLLLPLGTVFHSERPSSPGLGGGTAQDIGYVKERYPEVAQNLGLFNCALGWPSIRDSLSLGIAFHSE